MAVEVLGEAVLDVSPVPKRWTVDEFYRIGEVGIFRSQERVELIQGEIWLTSPIGDAHVWAVIRLTKILSNLAGASAVLSVQMPLVLGGQTLVFPDLAILREPTADNQTPTPTASLARMVVEVSDSSLSFDMNEMLRLHAGSEIPEYWVVDMNRRRIYVLSQPSGDSYSLTRLYQEDQVVASATLTELKFAVADVLPPRS